MSGSDVAPPRSLQGSQVWLRSFEPSDAAQLASWLNDAETAGYLPGEGPISSVHAAEIVADWIREHGRDAFRFVVCRRADDRPIGYVGLQRIDWINGSASIDIAIGDPASRGLGNGADALSVMIGFGFEMLRLQRIWLLVYAFNERAIATYSKLGMTLEGTFRRGRFYRGVSHDVHEMAILREEWDGPPGHRP